ncbi:BrnA antitoxin family protein [Candidatus Acetothermia bacterium]|jgi:rubredoxin|nr:BrnA antitoxin family protein [Candidatus Acetothermia bacterium]MCI2431410.1 BrnA antitoxin family protein [Candidatus Acetothermia bacterium]MCI2436177.1 BrnA antitoxin family protein [Candidatus Acetothermia bacterium]
MKLPKFRSEEEEATFWETHDFSKYLDELPEAQLDWEPDEDTCPHCGAAMQAERIEIEPLEGLCLRDLQQYRCPVCGTVQLASESLARINRIDGLIKRFGLAGLLLREEAASASKR